MARLVRCPKCQKLLVEYPNVPVYQCGGCGIVLRAKNQSDSTEEKLITEPAQTNQPESQSDVGFSDLESFSSPPAPATQCSKPGDQNSSPASNLDDHPRAVKRRSSRAANRSSLSRDDRSPQVDSVEEAVDRVEKEPVRLGIAYYDGSVSSSDEARSVESAERKSGKSRRTVKAASNGDLKLHSGSVRSAPSLPAMARFNAARDRASSSKGSFFDAEEFQITAENWSGSAKESSGGESELLGKVALLRKIDEVREQLVKISVGGEGRENFAPAANSWSAGSRRKADPIRKRPTTQHCRPVSGAAPFVICGNCAKLLQLPADFPSTRRRGLYKLRCAGCGAVLDLPFPAKDRSFSEAEADDELDSGGGRGVAARGNLTPRLHRLMGYDSASDLLLAGEEVDKGFERMESAGKRSCHGNVRDGIPRPPVMK